MSAQDSPCRIDIDPPSFLGQFPDGSQIRHDEFRGWTSVNGASQEPVHKTVVKLKVGV